MYATYPIILALYNWLQLSQPNPPFMKTLKIYLVLFVSLVSYHAFAQDTISGYIKTPCLQFSMPPDKLPDLDFRRTGDVLQISGMIQANCAGTHLAIVNRSGDSIFVTSKDTGHLATCSCVYNYQLKVKATDSDSILVLNQIVYNLNSVLVGMNAVDEKDDLIDVYYDPTIESMRIEQKSGVKMNSVSIYDHAGCLQLTVANDRSIVDMSGFKSGLYILDFEMVDNRHVTRKIMKNK